MVVGGEKEDLVCLFTVAVVVADAFSLGGGLLVELSKFEEVTVGDIV